MWSLYENNQFQKPKLLPPLVFSNTKNQEDIVKEVIKAIDEGHKVIFIKGVCGTGKSAIALNLARHFKKTSIVVPIKSLQEQYENDYTDKNFILKKDSNKLKISVIKGRQNFSCKFNDCKSDNPELPCTIEILQKNAEKIKKYLNMSCYFNDVLSVLDVLEKNFPIIF
jgi:Rad3-related DNA helicase